MKLFYLTGIYFYWLAVRTASLFNAKAKLFSEGRKGLLDKIRSAVPADRKVIWFHCASVGEFEQARPVIEKFRERSPEYFIVLTFFSPSGYELRKNYQFADAVFYLPMDFPRNAKAFVEAVHPEKAVFVKYEFWYFYLAALKKMKADIYIISAIFRPEQHFFRWYGGFFRKMLRTYRTLFVQDEASVALLRGIGIENAVLAGDTRFDRVFEITRSPKDIPVVGEFANGERPVFVAGSTWPPDHEIIVRGTAALSVRPKVVLVPHEIHESSMGEVESLIVSLGMNSVRYSRLTGLPDAEREQLSRASDFLIIDNVGMLSSIYRYADFSYVGGGFGVGIHNVLEAAAYGIPVIFGPNYHKFREAKGLIACGAGFTVDGQKSFDPVFSKLVSDARFREEAGRKADGYVRENLGATGIILESL